MKRLRSGMIGQYLLSPLVGKISDRYGPRACSFISSVLFSLGFGLFACEIARTPDDITQPSATSFHLLVVLFFMTGLATVSSWGFTCYSQSYILTLPQLFLVTLRRLEELPELSWNCIWREYGIIRPLPSLSFPHCFGGFHQPNRWS
jgi:hypothetical protein